ncbi:MAG: protein-disulfide reductase DsbD domain-containing protein [Pseudomonadota bacterium]
MLKFLKISITTLLLLCFSPDLHAGEWVQGDHFQARLAALPEGNNSAAMLEIEVDEGWHTYGPEPGDAGLPPRFNWEGSENLSKVEITFPTPIKKREFDMFDVNAYEGLTQLPLEIFPLNRDEDVALELDLQIMVCSDICIPAQAKLSSLLKAASHKP